MNDCEILEIKDEYEGKYTLQYMIDIYKESIDIEYEDVTTVKEAYQDKQINEETYNKYIDKLKKYKQDETELYQFIDKVKSLYTSRV